MHANLGAVEHLEAEDVEMFRWTSADDLGEAADADAHQLTARAFLRLLLAQLRVANLVHRQLQCGRVISAIVFPTERRLVRELLRLDEILHAKLRRVHTELMGHHIVTSFYMV